MKINQDDLEEKIIKKFQQKEKKKKRKMKVCGRKIFELKRIIEKKAKEN